MPRIPPIIIVFVLTLAAISIEGRCIAADDKGVEFFERKIRPVLVQHCYECHSTRVDSPEGGLRLDSRDGLLKGGDSGPAVVPRNVDESLLIQAIRHEGPEMPPPPKSKLPGTVIRDFEEWVRSGAGDPRTEPDRTIRGAPDVEAGRRFWSFQPVREAVIPPVRDADWPIDAIDNFVLSRLESQDLAPTKAAGRQTLVRRLTFDLIGLPPSPAEIDAFVRDESADALSKLVDRLLASPHFGERWGRHWLDVARFAESSGGGRSMLFPEAWRYRDYVVQSFNDDKPCDRFLTEQIAGDLLPHDTPDQRAEQLIATGFLVLGPYNYEEQDKAVLEMDVVDEQIDTLGRAVLGMTLGCARCHDHKFDPVPTRDYYALAGIFRSTRWLEHDNVSRWTEFALPVSPPLETVLAAHDQKVQALQAEIDALKSRLASASGDGSSTVNASTAFAKGGKNNLAALQKKLKSITDTAPYRPAAMAVHDAENITDCAICVRGSVHDRGEVAPRGFLQVATTGPMPALPRNQSGRRELAAWLTDAANPLTARVYVNRVWHHLMGAGLVRTVDNFGVAGETPSHPELLDHLAVHFQKHGWSTKHLIRTIVLSRSYQLAFTDNPSAAALDPENRLLWRANRKRLEAECLRDAMLAVSGSLDATMGGPTIRGLTRSDKAGNPSREYDYVFDDARRSVYTPVLRNRLPEIFEAFDFADPNQTIGARAASTTPAQALVLMNDPFVLEQARQAAQHLLTLPDLSDEQRLESAYRASLGRSPTAREKELHLGQRADVDWESVFHALFGSVEFRYIK